MKDNRELKDLVSVGPATIADLALLGITSVRQLARRRPRALYKRLCVITGARQDPCCEDVFAAAITQAKDANLPREQCRWWHWSRVRKEAAGRDRLRS